MLLCTAPLLWAELITKVMPLFLAFDSLLRLLSDSTSWQTFIFQLGRLGNAYRSCSWWCFGTSILRSKNNMLISKFTPSFWFSLSFLNERNSAFFILIDLTRFLKVFAHDIIISRGNRLSPVDLIGNFKLSNYKRILSWIQRAGASSQLSGIIYRHHITHMSNVAKSGQTSRYG